MYLIITFGCRQKDIKSHFQKEEKNYLLKKKSGAYSTIVNVFVDRLEDIDKEEYFKKNI